MSSDGPKSGRVGFGYNQAVEAGAPYEQSKSPSRINLDNFLKRRPEYRNRVTSELERGRRADHILQNLRKEGADGRYYAAFYSSQGFAKDKYTDSYEALVEEIERGIELNAFSCVKVQTYRGGKEGWSEQQTFPSNAIKSKP